MYRPATWWRSCCPTRPNSSSRCSPPGAWAPLSRRSARHWWQRRPAIRSQTRARRYWSSTSHSSSALPCTPFLRPPSWPRGPTDAEPALVSDDALALLIYTSGTTGRPKGVMLDHANLNAMCRMVIDAFSMTSADHSLLILPLFHVNGIVVGTLSPLIAGGRATIAGRFSPKTFFDRVEKTRATFFSAVPTMYTMLADLPADVRPDTSSVRFAVCGAAPASVKLLDKFETRYGIPLIEGYGLSEGSCASTGNPLNGKRKPGTVGLPLPGQTIRIVGADGSDVP